MTDIAIRFEGAGKTYPDGTTAVEALDLEIPRGSPHRVRRALGLRQDHLPADDQPHGRADLRHHHRGRRGRHLGAGGEAAPLHGLRHAVLRADAAPFRAGQHRHRSPAQRRLQGRGARSARRSCSTSSGWRPALGKRYPSQLSGGQQQRVGVARALAADPPVLLMDEPFSAVDPVVRDELQQELLRLQRDLAKTIVFVTHDIDEATVLGDKVAVFGLGGKLAQYATPEEILRAPANDFVASFVGRDRGFRHLAFSPSDGVTVHPVPDDHPGRTGACRATPPASGSWWSTTPASPRLVGPGQGRPPTVPGGSLLPEGRHAPPRPRRGPVLALRPRRRRGRRRPGGRGHHGRGSPRRDRVGPPCPAGRALMEWFLAEQRAGLQPRGPAPRPGHPADDASACSLPSRWPSSPGRTAGSGPWS